jgi:hypothetical protein
MCLQKALLIMGIYASLFVTYKIISSFGKKKEPVAIEAAPAATVGDNEIPSVDSPAFDAWLSGPGNIDKFFETVK